MHHLACLNDDANATIILLIESSLAKTADSIAVVKFASVSWFWHGDTSWAGQLSMLCLSEEGEWSFGCPLQCTQSVTIQLGVLLL